jgi:methionine sulfoxide reductase heme-binding subunit
MTSMSLSSCIRRVVEVKSHFRPLQWRVAGRRFGQWIALGMAVAPTVTFLVVGMLFALGVLNREPAVNAALTAVEVPGLVLLVAMMWCTPLSHVVGRPYRVERRAFGIGFGVTGFANLLMFLVEHPVRDLTRPFAVAASLAVVCVTPLLATSTRRAMHRLGSAAWTRLHRLAYVAAIALVVHLWLVPQDDGPTGNIVATVLLGGAMSFRVPSFRNRIIRAERARSARRNFGAVDC